MEPWCSFLFFPDLFPELQALLGAACDVATRQCLALTCRALYFTPAPAPGPVPGPSAAAAAAAAFRRPRLPWRAFAEHCVKEGHAALIDWAVRVLGMPVHFFTAWAVDALCRGHRHVLELSHFAEQVERWPRQFDAVVIDSLAAGRADEVDWLLARESPEVRAHLSVLALVRASNVEALARLPVVEVLAPVFAPRTWLEPPLPSGWPVACEHGTVELLRFLTGPPLSPTAELPPMVHKVAANRNPGVWAYLVDTFGLPSQSTLEALTLNAIAHDNVPLLRSLPRMAIQATGINGYALYTALDHHAFAAFDWLLAPHDDTGGGGGGGLVWDEAAVLKHAFTEKTKPPARWLRTILDALDARGLAVSLATLAKMCHLCDLPLLQMILGSARAAGGDASPTLGWLILHNVHAPDLFAMINCVIDHDYHRADPTVAAAILLSDDASHSQCQRVLAGLRTRDEALLLFSAICTASDSARQVRALEMIEAAAVAAGYDGQLLQSRDAISLLLSARLDVAYLERRLPCLDRPALVALLAQKWPSNDATFSRCTRLVELARLGLRLPPRCVASTVRGLLADHGRTAAAVEPLRQLLRAGISLGSGVTDAIVGSSAGEPALNPLVHFILEQKLPWSRKFFNALLLSDVSDAKLDAVLGECVPAFKGSWRPFLSPIKDPARRAGRYNVLAKHGLGDDPMPREGGDDV